MGRVAAALKERPLPSLSLDGPKPAAITLSIGVSECRDPRQIRNVFDRADKGAIQIKNLGKDRVTVAID